MAGREEQKRRQTAVARAKAEARGDLLRQVKEAVEAVPDTFPRAPSGVREARSGLTVKADILAAINKLRDREKG